MERAEEESVQSKDTTISPRQGDFMALLYFVFAVSDWFFSLVAFRLGVPEGNPFLAWCQQRSLFTPMKAALTLVATALIFILYPHRRSGRAVALLGVLLMAMVTAYHMFGLNVHLNGKP